MWWFLELPKMSLVNIIVVKRSSPLNNSTKLTSSNYYCLGLNQDSLHLIELVRLLEKLIIIFQYDYDLLPFQLPYFFQIGGKTPMWSCSIHFVLHISFPITTRPIFDSHVFTITFILGQGDGLSPTPKYENIVCDCYV
jgi:hypothetical protein